MSAPLPQLSPWTGRVAVRPGPWQVTDDDRVQGPPPPAGRSALRIHDLLADLLPGARRRRPVADMPPHPADQRVPLEQVDKTVVGEPRDEYLGHMLQRRADLQRSGQLLAGALPDGAPAFGQQRTRGGKAVGAKPNGQHCGLFSNRETGT